MHAWPWHVRLRIPAEMCADIIRLPEHCASHRLLVDVFSAVLKPADLCLKCGSGNYLPVRSHSSHASDGGVSGTTAGLSATLHLLSCRVAAAPPRLCAAAAPGPKGCSSCRTAPL